MADNVLDTLKNYASGDPDEGKDTEEKLTDYLQKYPTDIQKFDQFAPEYKQAAEKLYPDVLPGQVSQPSGNVGVFSQLPGRAQQQASQSGGALQEHNDILDLVRNLPLETDSKSLSKKIVDKSTSIEPEESLADDYDKATGTEAQQAPSSDVLQFGKGELGSVQALKQAQQQAGDIRLFNQLGQAAEFIGAGVSPGMQPRPEALSFYKEGIKNADQVVKDYVQQVAEQKNDPNSAYSQGFKNYLRRFGVHVEGDFTAAEGEKLVPTIYNEYKLRQEQEAKSALTKEVLKSREKIAQIGAESRETVAGSRAESKESGDIDKRFAKLNKDITAQVASSRSAFGRAANTNAGAQKILRLVQGRDLNSLDNREIAEVARSLDSILSQGQPTISGMNKLIPEAYVGKANKIAEMITNTRRGAQASSFLGQMINTVQREQELANEQIRDTSGQLLAGYSDLADKAPDRWNLMLEKHGLPKDILSPGTQTVSGKQVVKKGYNPSTNQTKIIYSDGSKEILEGRQ